MSIVNSTSTTSASDLRTDYMNLLIVQLQNQDPMDPVDNDQMTAQLAALSQLEQLENMNTTFEKVLAASQEELDTAKTANVTSLIGEDVTFFPPDRDSVLTGRVDYVEFVDGQARLVVDKYSMAMEDVLAVGGWQGGAEPIDGSDDQGGLEADDTE